MRWGCIWLSVALIEPVFAQRVITRIAGGDWLFPANGLPATDAPLSGSLGLDITVDPSGNYYLADPGNLMVMRVGSDGILHVIAGNGVSGVNTLAFASGDGGLAVNAAVFQPTAVAVDSNANVYIAEYGSRVRKVTPDGIISTFAGTGVNGSGGDGSPATEAQLNVPFGLAVDSSNNLYIADTYNNRIRKVTPDGIITTVAGNGQPGSTGDGGSALAAEIYQPTRLAADASGNLFFVETANTAIVPRLRKVDTHGNINTVAGGGLNFSDGIPALQAGIIPLAVAVDSLGNIYIIDGFGIGVRKVDTQGIITTISGGSGHIGFAGDGSPASSALFAFNGYPSLAVDRDGNIYIDDEGNNRIRRIAPDGVINTVAGNGQFRLSGNGGPASLATLAYPISVTGDQSGNLYVSEQTQNRIRRIAPDGTTSIYAGNNTEGFTGDGGPATAASLAFPGYLAIAPALGYLVFADVFNCRIRYVDNNGNIHTYAGSGTCQDSGNGGPAAKAGLTSPGGIDFDPDGDLYIAETLTNYIRAVLPPADSSIIGILAGDGKPGYSGDNGPSTEAEVNGPVGVRFHNGFLYFCDSGNNVVRKIDTTTTALTITTVAGNGQPGYSGDGGLATQASLNNPLAINFDAAGNMYIADQANRLIRMVASDGTISTFAGSMTAKGENDGGPAIDAGLGAITDLFIDTAGDVLLTDVFFNRLRAVLVSAPDFQASPASLAFAAPAGSTPLSQNVDVLGSIPGIPFTATADSSGWLQVSPSSGFMPTSIQITADPSMLSPGPNSGSVTITAGVARPSTHRIAVNLTTTAPGAPTLSVKPSSLTFSFVAGSAASSQTISVSNAGGGSLDFTVTAATVAGGPWLSASPARGTLGAFASTSISITADSAKLSPGTYSGTLTLVSANPPQSLSVPVTMTVTAVPQTILNPQTGLTFYAVQGGGLPPPQFFNILNTGVGLMPFAVTITTLSGGSWLSVFPASGSSDASSTTVPEIRLDANPKGLAAGVYYATVQISSSGANNSPQFVCAILYVLPAGSTIGPLVEPTGLIFTGVAGGESPGSQTITVESTDANPVTFHSGQVTASGGAWLTSVPSDGTVTPNQSIPIVIQPRTAGLAAGLYRGTLTLSFSDGFTRTVALVLVLVPAGSTIANTHAHADTAGCTPKLLAPVFTQLSSGFSIPAGFPGQVTVDVVDNCANPMTSGQVVVSFSNGDPPLQLVSLKNGNWAGTWTPINPAAQVTVMADAETANGLNGEVSIRGGLQTQTQPPVVGPGAVVNGASFAPSAPLAPGSLVTIFGSKLAQSQAYASSLPLPTDLGGSSIALAGRQAPLLFTSDGQVNAILPYGTAVNTQQQLLIARGNTLSVPQTVTVAPVAPGIFTADGSGKGQGTIFLGNSNLIAGPANPAHAGDVVVIYCTGLGEVSPAVPSGSPAPGTPPASTVNAVNVTIGGVAAEVQFAGLTPGLVGVYQVNAVVPAIPAGDQVPVMILASGQQSAPVTIAVK